jgi:acetyl-CoA C-acetyltransferase
MTIKGKAYIAGIYEHPTRKADDKSLAQLHAEVAKGALEDAGLTRADVDGFFCAGDAPGWARCPWWTTWGSRSATWIPPRPAARPM